MYILFLYGIFTRNYFEFVHGVAYVGTFLKLVSSISLFWLKHYLPILSSRKFECFPVWAIINKTAVSFVIQDFV